MASQVTSGYSTEGTQYAQNNSFYLLDTVPGAGAAIPGPVTIAGNLTVTGTTTLQGAAGATSLNTNSITAGPASATYAASGNLAITSATQLSLQGASVGVTATAGALNLASSGAGSIVMNPAAGGSMGVTSPTINVTASAAANVISPIVQITASTQATVTGNFAQVISAGNGTLQLGPSVLGNAKVRLQSTTGNISLEADTNQSLRVVSDAFAAANGFGVQVKGKLDLIDGLSLASTQGTFAAPALATNLGGAYGFTMLGNKAFITTGGAVGISLTIDFPGGGGKNWIPILTQIGTNQTNVASYQTNGDGLVITPSNILNPVIVGIVVL